MDQHSEEAQKYKGAITEQTRSLEVLDRNMQNVSREITAIVGKIEEDRVMKIIGEWLQSDYVVDFSFFDRSSEFHSAGRVCFEREKKSPPGNDHISAPKVLLKMTFLFQMWDMWLLSQVKGTRFLLNDTLNLLKEMSEQTTCDRVAANSLGAHGCAVAVNDPHPTPWGRWCCVDIAGGRFTMASDSLIE